MRDTRWPAEWEPQEAVWFSWPHRDDIWPQSLTALEQTFAQLINTAAQFQKVCINASAELHSRIVQCLDSLESIELYNHPTNDVWCRDHGATFVLRGDQLHAVDWSFNAWGGKFPPWDLDDAIATQMAKATGASHYRSPLYLEGGAIEGNGNGVVLTTEAVALNPNRNPHWNKAMVEQELKQTLGAETIFWLPRGIEGDDTDGHIDDLTRFVAEQALVTSIELNSQGPNYSTLAENRERLEDLRCPSGSKIEIIDLPMPEPISTDQWRLPVLPASYANFLILNQAVLVPTFNQAKNDDRALGIMRECFPQRQVIGLDCRDILFEGGAIHCLTQQQPEA